jgi:hypothetical protein
MQTKPERELNVSGVCLCVHKIVDRKRTSCPFLNFNSYIISTKVCSDDFDISLHFFGIIPTTNEPKIEFHEHDCDFGSAPPAEPPSPRVAQ